jgi:hypothetical protein
MKALYIIVAALALCVGALAWQVGQLAAVVRHYETEFQQSARAIMFHAYR